MKLLTFQMKQGPALRGEEETFAEGLGRGALATSRAQGAAGVLQPFSSEAPSQGALALLPCPPWRPA